MKAALMNQNTLPFVAPPGPLASAPAASGYPAGAMVYDNVTSKLYQCDYAGNFVNNGSTGIADKVQPTISFNPNNDFLLEIAFRQDADAVGFTGLYCQSVDGSGGATSSRGLWIERDNLNYVAKIHNAAGATIFTGVFASVINGDWHSLILNRVGSTVVGLKDGVQVFSGSPSGTANSPLYTSIGSLPNNRTINGQMCCVEAIAPVGSFKYRFNQLSGTTITDLSGNGNTGTLTDGSPATFSGNKYWIPRELIA